MKTSRFTVTLPAFILAATISTSFSHAQTTASSVPVSNVSRPTLPAPTPYSAVSRDANSAIWQRTTYELSPSGQVVPRTHQYTELATGLNFWSNGQWTPSREEIDLLPNGMAAATNGQHQVYFPSDVAQSVIALTTPDGLKLQSRPIALSYDDGSNTVLIAELTNSTGAILPSRNQAIYQNAFTGIAADLLYTYTKAGFEQDIILREQPPDPAAFGLNPQTTRLQVLTEFFNPPQPSVTATTVPTAAGNLEDDALTFGTMKMMRGRAFSIGNGTQAHSWIWGTPTYKSWSHMNGRTFLVEEVLVEAIADELSQLPVPQTSLAKPNPPLNVVSTKRLLPDQRLVTVPSKHAIQLVQNAPLSQGLVLDYQVLNGGLTNCTFQGDTTYYISGAVDLWGTNTFEGGTVLKYASGASVNLESGSGLNWLGSAYRPVVFTAVDDNSMGDTITNSTGYPTNYYANPALNFDTWSPSTFTYTLSNFRIAWAAQAIGDFSTDLNLYHGQLVNCQIGIASIYSDINLRNLLFANVQSAFDGTVYGEVDVQNTTFSGSLYLTADLLFGGMSLENCILANVTNLTNSANYYYATFSGDHNGFYNSPEFGTGPVTNTFYPFQSVGGGNYYLTNGCGFFNAGTMNIDPTLLEQLRQKTTYPPSVYTPQTIYYDLYLGPQTPRDSENPGPDLGYHYDPIDWAFSGVVVTSATIATVTISPGTVIAAFGTNGSTYGLSIGSGAQLISDGTAAQPCRIVTYNTVQEGPDGGWQAPTLASVTDYIGGAGGMFDFQFTDWSMFGPANASHLIIDQSNPVNMRDCQFHGGSLVTYLGPTINLTNCLFDRVYLALYPDDTNTPVLRNNLFYGGTLDLLPFVTSQSVVQDNLFDRTTIWNHNPPCTYTGYNAYVTNCNRLQPTSAGDIILTNSPAYQTGPLGNYYQPTNSPLIDNGSDTVDDVGLTGYTILTNQSPDTGTVDIGYHYATISPPVVYDDPYEQSCPNDPHDFYLGYDGYGYYAYDPNGLPLTFIVVTQPAHGTLNYGSIPGEFIYTPNSCYEGVDSFTFKVTDGVLDSTNTATVTLTTGDTVSTYYSPSPAQTCKNTPLSITLGGYDSCGEDSSTFTYTVLANPTNGVLTGTGANLTYTPTNVTFTGMDHFTYKVSTVCGDSATNTVTIIVGDDNVSANSQTTMTGTNQPLNITLTASNLLGCTNSFNYTIVDNLTNGTLSGTGTSRTYTPTNGEGVDSFNFTASDGVWNSPYPDAQVTIFVVAGPQLTAQCNPNGPGILLNWSLDAIVQQMELQGLNILDFKIYRATSSGGPYGDPIYTAGPTDSSYVDTTATPNDDYYYVVTFRYQDPSTSTIYESPYSNESHATGCCPGDSAFWVDSGPRHRKWRNGSWGRV